MIKKYQYKKRRIRKTLGCIYFRRLSWREKKVDVYKKYKKLKKKGIYVETNPIKYIQTTYISHIQELTAKNKPTENDRGTWTQRNFVMIQLLYNQIHYLVYRKT